MPFIAELFFYPIKSCAGIRLDRAELGATGLRHQGVADREWMVVDLQGLFLSQRELPKMASIRPTVLDAVLSVEAPGQAPLLLPLERAAMPQLRQVQVWDDVLQAEDAGDAAASWFTEVLGQPCRLVRFGAASARFASAKWTGDIQAATRFADGYPILLTSCASLDDLNARARLQGRSAIPATRFRPNIVLDGMEAFEEDYAEHFLLGDGICLRPVKPCTRCPIPSIDQDSGEIGDNPLDILQTYRANPIVGGEITFGMNLIIIEGLGQFISRGDQVEMPIAF